MAATTTTTTTTTTTKKTTTTRRAARVAPLLLPLLLLLLRAKTATATAAATTAADTDADLSAFPAHCECRCCTRAHFRTTCIEPPHKLPLPPQSACDSRLATLQDASVCSVAMCNHNFPHLCPPPSFFQHTCVTHKSFLREWGPYIFSVFTLVLLAVLVHCFMRANETRVPLSVTPFLKRRPSASPVLPAMHVLRPRLSPSSTTALLPSQPPSINPSPLSYATVATLPRLPPVSTLTPPAASALHNS